MLNFGMCACGGYVQRAALPMIQESENMAAVAAFDVNPEQLESACRTFDIPHSCATYEELLGVEDVDVVYIASPNVLHKDQAVAAAAAGKHVFCQKPLATTAADCRTMIDACSEAEVQLGVGFCNRFGGAQVLAQGLIADGRIGEVSHMNFSFSLCGYTKETVGWRCDPKLSGGGPLMDLAPHIIDFARVIFGDEVESAMAYVRPPLSETEVERDVVAIMEFRQGARLTMEISFIRGNRPNYTIIGNKGQIHATSTMVWLTRGEMFGTLILQADGKEQELPFATDEHIGHELEIFCRAIESGEEVPVSGDAGWRAQAVIDAIFASAAEERRIQVCY